MCSCQKDLQSDKIAAGTVSDLSTDGTLSVQVSIAPPVTPASFLPNSPGGSASFASYDLVAGPKKVYIDYFHMTASYPIVFGVGGVPNRDGITPVPINYQVFANSATSVPISLLYNPVDSSTSPTIATCRLNDVVYHTEDWTPYTLKVNRSSGTAFSMCLVNNIAHLGFKSPAAYKVQNDGSVEMARIRLTGDTAWTLNSLPVNFYFPDFSFGTYPDKIVLKADGQVIATDSALAGHTGVLRIKGGFKHIAGKIETLRVYGYNMSIQLPGFFVTEMGDLNGLIWKDGLGGLIPGRLNAQYYKEKTGQASLYNH